MNKRKFSSYYIGFIVENDYLCHRVPLCGTTPTYFQALMKTYRIDPLTPENDKLLQNLFSQQVKNLTDVRLRNLINKYITDYRQVEIYLNDRSLRNKWHGAGETMMSRAFLFFEGFYQDCHNIINGPKEKTMVKMIAYDYPFLTKKERTFVAQFLHDEGRYPVVFIALRYLRTTTNRKLQVFATANGIVGKHRRFETIAQDFDLTRERVRQVSLMDITHVDDAAQTWNKERWSALDFLNLPLLTEDNTNWEVLRRKERLTNLDFYSALTIFRQLTPLNIVAMRYDGRKANSRLSVSSWKKPNVLFAYDSRLTCCKLEDALIDVAHESNLHHITDCRKSMADFIGPYFTSEPSDTDRQRVMNILREVIPMYNGVEMIADEIVFRANHINYLEEIYQILQGKGQAMTVDDIYEEFRQRNPSDHHTKSGFIRSYMLRDKRFEAVGSKSTYQLREWQRFAGALGDLAVLLMADRDEPVKAEVLCRQMMERRPNTTLKSCNTSIYLAVNARRLQFYVDAEALAGNTIASENADAQADAEVSRYHVGLFDHPYSERFWPATLTVEGTILSMKRFLKENGRWPFCSSDGIEKILYRALRKYTLKRCITEEEGLRYQQGMADINPLDYPYSERDQVFLNRCRELDNYCQRYHLLPTTGKLILWYRQQLSQIKLLSDFRRYHLQKLLSVIGATLIHTPAKPSKPSKPTSTTTEQLQLDFTE